MPEFKLIKKEFSDKFQEWWWTYECLFKLEFNKRIIMKITIADHYQQEHPDITNESILELLVKLKGEILESMEYDGGREPYKWEIVHRSKPYRLFFWFKDGTTDHLWVRNCHRIDKIIW
jgi:hypothetical protein